jgi:predicted dehydrogenase
MERIRVGVIGCGGIAQMMHLPHLRDLSDRYEIETVCDLSAQVANAIGDLYAVPKRTTDYRQVIASDVDAVFILNPGAHGRYVVEALNAGKHVFVEKPMCFTLREADEIVAAQAASGRQVMVGYMKRYDPGYRYAQAALPALGQLRYVQINVLHPDEAGYRGIYPLVFGTDVPRDVLALLEDECYALSAEAMGALSRELLFVYYDIFLGSLVHDVNVLRGLIGEPEAVLFTDIWGVHERQPSVTTILRYPGDVRAVITWTYLPDLRNYFQEVALVSATGRLRIQFPSPYLRNFPTPIVVESMDAPHGAYAEKRVTASYAEAFKEELIHFHDCVVNGKTPLTDAYDARRDIQLLQHIMATAKSYGLGGEAIQPATGL